MQNIIKFRESCSSRIERHICPMLDKRFVQDGTSLLFVPIWLSQRVGRFIVTAATAESYSTAAIGHTTYIEGLRGTAKCLQQIITASFVLGGDGKGVLAVVQPRRKQENEARRLVEHNHVVVQFRYCTCKYRSQRNVHRWIVSHHCEVLAVEGKVASSRGIEVRGTGRSILSAANVELRRTLTQYIYAGILDGFAQRLSLSERDIDAICRYTPCIVFCHTSEQSRIDTFRILPLPSILCPMPFFPARAGIFRYHAVEYDFLINTTSSFQLENLVCLVVGGDGIIH